jgi:hypothetical protein
LIKNQAPTFNTLQPIHTNGSKGVLEEINVNKIKGDKIKNGKTTTRI